MSVQIGDRDYVTIEQVITCSRESLVTDLSSSSNHQAQILGFQVITSDYLILDMDMKSFVTIYMKILVAMTKLLWYLLGCHPLKYGSQILPPHAEVQEQWTGDGPFKLEVITSDAIHVLVNHTT